MGTGMTVPLGKNSRLPAGSYRVRYREDLGLALDRSLVLPNNEKWVNPTDLVLTEKAIYVYDQGLLLPNKGEGKIDYCMDGGTTSPYTNTPYIYKFNRDGTPDVKFGDRGRLGPLSSNCIRSFGVDDQGWIYVGSTYHEALVYDLSGEKTPMKIGGYDTTGPNVGKATVGVNSVVCGPNKRIYFPGLFGELMVYDRTKEGFAGFLYKALVASTRQGMHRCIAIDGEGAVYVVDSAGGLQKFNDTGKQLVPSYAMDPSVKLRFPIGPSALGGLIWLAAHGGPPQWDMDGGEVVLCWDDGESIQSVQRFGSPGSVADKLQFMNPSAAVQTPDHLELWVVEDGLSNGEGPPGNARGRKFRIPSSKSEEVPLEWRGANP